MEAAVRDLATAAIVSAAAAIVPTAGTDSFAILTRFEGVLTKKTSF